MTDSETRDSCAGDRVWMPGAETMYCRGHALLGDGITTRSSITVGTRHLNKVRGRKLQLLQAIKPTDKRK